uniref:TEPSIN adaptor related protein complex 4 accessory protein n=1 Tax=Astyanax mexicanus TaxID=7994 RepID=A0A8B9KHA5_ASTMX
MATLMERLTFLQKVPTLMKATADDEVPCPGYLFQDINKISHESLGCCQCLLEYLLERLQVESCHVKLKVLKILLHLCGHGPPHFLTELRRNATFIQEVTVLSFHQQSSLGFVYMTTTIGQWLLPLLQWRWQCQHVLTVCPLTATKVSCAHTDPHNSSSSKLWILDSVYIREFCSSLKSNSLFLASHRCPGQAGGGWEETGSGHSSSHNSSLEIEPLSHTSRGDSSKSGETGSHSGASRESGDLAERVEAMQLGDCGQEMALISSLTNGSKIFLSRDESQHFIKECSTLNCEVVVELLSHKLKDIAQTVQMRALCGLACLMSTDLLSLDQIFCVTHKRLAQLSEEVAGPVANKSTKLLRQFEALLGSSTPLMKTGIAVCPESSSPSLSKQPLNPTIVSPLLLPTTLDVEAPSSMSSTNFPHALSSEHGLKQEHTVTAAAVGESAENGVQVEDPQTVHEDEDKYTEPARHHPTLSLFSGMELVNRGKPVCLVEPVLVEPDVQTGAEGYTGFAVEKSSERTADSSLSTSGEQISAFSFVNL